MSLQRGQNQIPLLLGSAKCSLACDCSIDHIPPSSLIGQSCTLVTATPLIVEKSWVGELLSFGEVE